MPDYYENPYPTKNPKWENYVPASLKGDWIDVSKRRPETAGWYMVLRDGVDLEAFRSLESGGWWDRGFGIVNGVTHWKENHG